jgi:putative Holliday junction resolvase
VTGRILAVDFGERRIGLALSDPGRMIASPFSTLPRRRGKRPPIADLIDIMEAQDVTQVIVGLPLTLAGDDSEWTVTVRAFAQTLAERSGRPVTLVDERFSSVMAERAVRGSGLKKSEREDKTRIDAAAAAIILQSFLNTRERVSHTEHSSHTEHEENAEE